MKNHKATKTVYKTPVLIESIYKKLLENILKYLLNSSIIQTII